MTQIGEHGPLGHTSALDWNFSLALQSQKGQDLPAVKSQEEGPASTRDIQVSSMPTVSYPSQSFKYHSVTQTETQEFGSNPQVHRSPWRLTPGQTEDRREADSPVIL